jgi:prophage tail gpP-like protein
MPPAETVVLTVRTPGRPERGITLDTADDYDVTQDVFSPANHFRFRLGLARPSGRPLTAAYLAALRSITWPDTTVELTIDGCPAGAAFLEEQVITAQGDEEYIEASGRDPVALLLDNTCAPKVSAATTLPELADSLLAQYRGLGLDLNVIIGNGGNRDVMTGGKKVVKPRSTIRTAAGVVQRASNAKADEFYSMPLSEAKPHAGEKEWALLDRHAKNVGVLAWSDAEGNLVLATPGYDQEPLYSFRQKLSGTGNNVVSAVVKRSTHGAATSVRVLGHAQGRGEMREQIDVTEKLDTAAYVAALRSDGRTNPDAITLPRKVVVHDAHAESSSRARKLARRTLARACAGLVAVEYTVEGHSQAGRVYAVDTIADVDDERGGVKGLFWVTMVRHTGRRAQRTTTLRMIPKGALVV